MSILFLQPGFLLAGAAAVSLPILIHLMLRQRARAMPIGSVRFLKDVLRQHTRRRRIKQWLLLALRMLAILLLALLFARPYFDRSHIEGLNREVCLLVDRSASMQVDVDGQSAFELAVAKANEQLRRIDDNTAVHVAWFDASGVEEISVEGMIDGDSTAGHAATDYRLALAWARDILVSSERQQRHVEVITDLQSSGLQSTTTVDFPADIDVHVHDVGRQMTTNIAIEDCRATATEIRPKNAVKVAARLYNAGAVPAKDVQVAIALKGPQGEIGDRQSISIAGGARTTVEFLLDVQQDGVYEGQVTIDRDDELAFDNQRWLALEARHPDRVLLVDGQQGRSVFANETYYLETVLRLQSPVGDLPPRTYEVERIVWDDGDGFPDLAGFRVIVMCNVGRWSKIDIERAVEYVRDGGSLLIFCGNQTETRHIDMLRDAGLLSLQMRPESLTGGFRVNRWTPEHAIFSAFSDPQYGDLRTLVFERMVQLQSPQDPARVVLEAGRHPLLIEQPLGRGRTILFASSADADWSSWPRSRLYVPLVRQLIAYATDQLGERQTVRYANVDAGDEGLGISTTDGLVTVRNVESRESLLERVSEEDFRSALGLSADDSNDISPEAAAAIGAPPGAEKPNESWTLCLWLLFAVLAVELLLATRTHA